MERLANRDGVNTTVWHDAKLKMTACLAKYSPDVLDFHPFMVPLSQDDEVRTWRGTYQPVRIVILANANCQIAMLFRIEIPIPSFRLSNLEIECPEP